MDENEDRSARVLREAAVQAMGQKGYEVRSEMQRGRPEGSFLKVTRGPDTAKVSVRTTRDRWIAFRRKGDDSGWDTLDEVEFVLASAVGVGEEIECFLIRSEKVRAAFDAALAAKRARGSRHIQSIWVCLDPTERRDVPKHATGLAAHAEWRVAIRPNGAAEGAERPSADLTDVRKLIALRLGVAPSAVRIWVEL